MKIDSQNQALRFIAEEDLILANIGSLRTVLQDALTKESSAKQAILDLSAVRLIDSSGIQLIIGLAKTCEEKKLELEVLASSAEVQRVFNLCKLDTIVKIHKETIDG